MGFRTEKRRKKVFSRHFLNINLFRSWRFWIFLWGILFTSMKSLTGKAFEVSGHNLTALYGSIELAAAFLSTVLLKWIYPKILKKYQLGTVLLISSLVLFAFGAVFITVQSFYFGILAFLAYKLLEESFITMSISTKFSLYRSQARDRLRLLTEIMARSLGGALIAMIFLLPEIYVNIFLITVLVVMIFLGLKTKTNFNVEVINFLVATKSRKKIMLLHFLTVFKIEVSVKDYIPFREYKRHTTKNKYFAHVFKFKDRHSGSCCFRFNFN